MRTHRLTTVTATLAVAALTAVAGCSAEEGGEIGASVGSAVEGARGAVDGARGAVEDAQSQLENLDPDGRAQVEEAVRSAGAAIEKATAALDGSAPDAAAARAEAETALADARAQLDEAAGSVDGVAKTGLDRLGKTIDDLRAQLESAG